MFGTKVAEENMLYPVPFFRFTFFWVSEPKE
jgi:hypothetical protein